MKWWLIVTVASLDVFSTSYTHVVSFFVTAAHLRVEPILRRSYAQLRNSDRNYAHL